MQFFANLAKICLQLKNLLDQIDDRNIFLKLRENVPFEERQQISDTILNDVYSQSIILLTLRNSTLLEKKKKKTPLIEDFIQKFWDIVNVFPKTVEISRKLQKLVNLFIKTQKMAENSFISDLDFIEQIYTPFITQLYPKYQKKFGIVYTPNYIILFIIRMINHLLKIKFQLPMGIQSKNLILYDPAVGSLSFEIGLCSIITSHEWRTKIFPKMFYGNELNIPAYFIGRFLLSNHVSIENNEIIEKNENSFMKKLNLNFESSLSPKFKQNVLRNKENQIKPLIIFGNPPYSVSSSNKGEWIQDLMKKYAVKEPNLTRLYDDYVKFIRYGEWLLEDHDSGIIAYISNRKYLDGKIFYGMRKTLLESFDYIYIVDLCGDLRNIKRDKVGDNIFGIQTGVAILFLVKIKSKSQNNLKMGKIFYIELNEKKEFIQQFLQQDISSLKFEEIIPMKPNYLFIPINIEGKLLAFWNTNFLSLPKCFKKSSRAMISSRDKFMINVDLSVLNQNIDLLEKQNFKKLRDLGRIKRKEDKILENEKILSTFDYTQMKKSIYEINYRAFDVRHAIFYTINRRCGKSIILEDLQPKKAEGINKISKNQLDIEILNKSIAINFVQSIQKAPFSHVLITEGIIDSGLFGYSTSKLAPLYINEQINISDLCLKMFQNVIQNVELIHIFEYIYGILNSPFLNKMFESLLFHEYPRIFIPNNSIFFYNIRELGNKLMNSHLFRFSDMENNEMRKNYEIFKNSLQDIIQLHDFSFDPIDQTIILKEILDTGKERKILIECSDFLWNYKIGSIYVIKNWLNARKISKINRPLKSGEFLHLFKILFIIKKTITIKNKIDEIVQIAFKTILKIRN